MIQRSDSALICCLLIVLLLPGCGAWKTAKKVGQVVMDPDIPVGTQAEQPSIVSMTLLAEPDININEDGEATPVEIQVLYLKEDSKLLGADYDNLMDSDVLAKTLGKNYIDHQDYTLLPEQYKPLPLITLDEKNYYVGVIAHYIDIHESEWKKVVPIKGIGKKYHILIHVRSNEIELRKKEEE